MQNFVRHLIPSDLTTDRFENRNRLCLSYNDDSNDDDGGGVVAVMMIMVMTVWWQWWWFWWWHWSCCNVIMVVLVMMMRRWRWMMMMMMTTTKMLLVKTMLKQNFANINFHQTSTILQNHLRACCLSHRNLQLQYSGINRLISWKEICLVNIFHKSSLI